MVAFHANRTPSTFLSGMWTQLGVNSHGQRDFFFLILHSGQGRCKNPHANGRELMRGAALGWKKPCFQTTNVWAMWQNEENPCQLEANCDRRRPVHDGDHDYVELLLLLFFLFFVVTRWGTRVRGSAARRPPFKVTKNKREGRGKEECPLESTK